MTYRVDACRREVDRIQNLPRSDKQAHQLGDAYLALARALLSDYPRDLQKIQEAGDLAYYNAQAAYAYLRQDSRQEVDEIAEAEYVYALAGEQYEEASGRGHFDGPDGIFVSAVWSAANKPYYIQKVREYRRRRNLPSSRPGDPF